MPFDVARTRFFAIGGMWDGHVGAEVLSVNSFPPRRTTHISQRNPSTLSFTGNKSFPSFSTLPNNIHGVSVTSISPGCDLPSVLKILTSYSCIHPRMQTDSLVSHPGSYRYGTTRSWPSTDLEGDVQHPQCR